MYGKNPITRRRMREGSTSPLFFRQYQSHHPEIGQSNGANTPPSAAGRVPVVNQDGLGRPKTVCNIVR